MLCSNRQLILLPRISMTFRKLVLQSASSLCSTSWTHHKSISSSRWPLTLPPHFSSEWPHLPHHWSPFVEDICHIFVVVFGFPTPRHFISFWDRALLPIAVSTIVAVLSRGGCDLLAKFSLMLSLCNLCLIFSKVALLDSRPSWGTFSVNKIHSCLRQFLLLLINNTDCPTLPPPLSLPISHSFTDSMCLLSTFNVPNTALDEVQWRKSREKPLPWWACTLVGKRDSRQNTQWVYHMGLLLKLQGTYGSFRDFVKMQILTQQVWVEPESLHY